MDLPSAILLAAYVAMAAELRFAAVPSVVSTRSLLAAAGSHATPAARLALAAPIALIWGLFLIPVVLALFPKLMRYFGPLDALALPALRWAGAALLACGKVVTFASLPPLRRALARDELARSGLFARSRHPGLVGMFLFYLGALLMFPCAVLAAGFPFYVFHMHGRASMEEAYLRTRFPAQYPEYAKRVPRYVGLRSLTGGRAPGS